MSGIALSLMTNHHWWQSDERPTSSSSWLLEHLTHASLKNWRKCVTASRTISSGIVEHPLKTIRRAIGRDLTNLNTDLSLSLSSPIAFPKADKQRGDNLPSLCYMQDSNLCTDEAS